MQRLTGDKAHDVSKVSAEEVGRQPDQRYRGASQAIEAKDRGRNSRDAKYLLCLSTGCERKRRQNKRDTHYVDDRQG
ncbi:MAG: hypothetical protein AMJ46_14110 [Latescibacteria bacterium DG_63]|nr:MAG: hypothetical protein AMJ46_14110 [Latescibacteria bacterium DG_63]